jgi:hypothetical protein
MGKGATFVKRLQIAAWLLAGFCWLPAGGYAKDCSGLPTQFNGNEFPKGDFLSNFNNNCYLIPFSTGIGGVSQGDTNSVYNRLYFEQCPLNEAAANGTACGTGATIPPFELIILGEFPNARYFSISLYDNHSAITSDIEDVNIVPLTSSDINPYQPGVAYVSGQRYGAAIHLGGTPGNLQKGCMMTGNNIESNGLDGTQRHPFMNWNLSPSFFLPGPPYQHPDHEVDTPEHSNPNPAGVIMIRSFLDLTTIAGSQAKMIVRDVASGCAYPAAYIASLANVETSVIDTGNTWQNQVQVQQHNLYANWQPTDCWGSNAYSKIQWLREDEYVAGANPDSGYLLAYVPAGTAQNLANADQVMRLRFRVPTTPPTPCVDGCSLSGNEQMRYMSLSFEVTGGDTLASLADSCPPNPVTPCIPLIQDANGNVTLIVGTGVTQPTNVTAANGYTWLDLTQYPNYLQWSEMIIRHILPAAGFNCSTQFVPYKTEEATTGAVQKNAISGLMGFYEPWIDYPLANARPAAASPIACPRGQSCIEGCAIYPDAPPDNTASTPACGVQSAPAVTITSLTTQCSSPTCTNVGYNQIIAQTNPPISILGTGFGSFPLGIPYTGNSNFVQIQDTTQGWTAGYTGSPCTVTIGEWSGSAISLIANVNQGVACPMVAGDSLTVTVTNPQTLVASAPFTTTVLAQSGPARKQ